MIPEIVKKYMSPLEAGFGSTIRDGMRLHIRHSYSDFTKSNLFTVGLYVMDSAFENSVESLDKALSYFESSPWYPSATGSTLEEAFAGLAAKLEKADEHESRVLPHEATWYGLVFSAMFNYTTNESNDELYKFDANAQNLFTELKDLGGSK